MSTTAQDSSGVGGLTGKVSVVTGASRGIGRVIALELAADGSTVVLASRDEEALEETSNLIGKAGGRSLHVVADISSEGDVKHLLDTTVSTLGSPDVLVCNSGIAGPAAALVDVKLDDWNETFRVNVTGTFLCLREFLPSMVQRRSGSVVIIGSMSGKRPLPHRAAYTSSKLALVGMVRTVAHEVGPSGVRVNLISPGPVEGPRIDWVLEKQAEATGTSREMVRSSMEELSALGRFVDATEIARVTAFLASEGASGITGADINVSAGLVMY